VLLSSGRLLAPSLEGQPCKGQPRCSCTAPCPHTHTHTHSILWRIFFGGIHERVPFVEVVLTDILTSFAPMFGDAWIVLMHVLLPTRIPGGDLSRTVQDEADLARVLPSFVDAFGLLLVW
jgi:hypothetical protein